MYRRGIGGRAETGMTSFPSRQGRPLFHVMAAAAAAGLLVLGSVTVLAEDPAENAPPPDETGTFETGETVGFEEQEQALKLLLEEDEGDLESAYQLGNLYYDHGRRQEAEAAYRNALKIDPKHVPSLVNLGVVLNESGRSEEALQYFDRALAKSPDDVLVMCNKGQALYALKRYNEAVDLYLRAVKVDPQSQLAHYWLGVAFADAGIYREAIKEWKRVVEIDPDSDAGRTAGEGVKVLEDLVDGR